MINKDIDPERDGLPWREAFSDYAEPQLSKELVQKAQKVFQTLERLEKKDRRWLDPKYFSDDVLSFNFFGEEWQDKINDTLWGRDKAIQVIHNYRHAYWLLHGWFINQLKMRKMFGYVRKGEVGYLLPLPNNRWELKSWVGTKDKAAASFIRNNGDVSLDGQQYYDLHIVYPGHTELKLAVC